MTVKERQINGFQCECEWHIRDWVRERGLASVWERGGQRLRERGGVREWVRERGLEREGGSSVCWALESWVLLSWQALWVSGDTEDQTGSHTRDIKIKFEWGRRESKRLSKGMELISPSALWLSELSESPLTELIPLSDSQIAKPLSPMPILSLFSQWWGREALWFRCSVTGDQRTADITQGDVWSCWEAGRERMTPHCCLCPLWKQSVGWNI